MVRTRGTIVKIVELESVFWSF